ncbi:MAG: Fe2+-enterobactin ABC transporter substrate-binding protein [Nitriliruptoraceae bacterium]
MSHRRRTASVPVLLATLLVACSGSEPMDSTTDQASDQADAVEEQGSAEQTGEETAEEHESEGEDGPRIVEHEFGTTEVPADPQRIVSASVTLTGHLLALEVPVIASATTAPSPIAADDGFLLQWADVARDRGVDVLPGGQEVDLEAIADIEPDLIVGSAFGGDAVTPETYELLSDIAPTIVYDASGRSWQDLLTTMAEAVGGQQAAEGRIADFAELATEVAASVAPEHPVVAFTAPPDSNLNVFTPMSAHGRLLADLGFELTEVDGADAGLQGGGERSDVTQVSPEQASDAFGESTVLVVFAPVGPADDVMARLPTVDALPGPEQGRVLGLGFTSFRIDPYSAFTTAETIRDELVGAAS